VYVKEGNSSWQLYYIFRDYLGSILHVRTSTGTAIQELSYDAWGRLRKPADHEVYGPDNQPDLFLGRGYTGHEHLPWFGLVNMNARLYDAAVGRFLSPDPIIPNPLNSQDFNRYSYVLNNPLKYNDISGMKPKCKYEGMSNHERNKRNRMRMKDSMDGGSECGEFGVNGSHNRWDGFGAGWGDGGDDYSIGHGGFGGHSGGFGGGGGGGGGNCWGRSRNGGGTINSIDFTFGHSGNSSTPPRPNWDFSFDFGFEFGWDFTYRYRENHLPEVLVIAEGPDIIIRGKDIYVMRLSDKKYVKLTDKSLKREFDREYAKHHRGPNWSPIANTRFFETFLGFLVPLSSPLPPVGPFQTPGLTEISDDATVRHYERLLKYYKKYNIIK